MIRVRKGIGVLLAMILAVGLVLNVSATGIKKTKDKAETVENQRDKAKEEQQALKDKVNGLASSMKQMEEELEQKRAEIEEAEQELIMARVKEQDQHESMKYRIRYMYENGDGNFLTVLLEANSITDFLNKVEYITKMSEYDREQLEEYQQTIRTVEAREERLEAEQEDLEVMRTDLMQQQAEAKKLLEEKNAEVKNLDLELGEIKRQIKLAEDEEKKRQEAHSKPINPGKPQGSVVSGNGYFTHPCPGMSYRSSYFGEVRSFDPEPHNGIDYAAPEGTPIYAGAAGTVVIAGKSTSAGYWVVINHGNGLVSKYMHMYTTPFVREGQTVVKGQHIGGVGTTGYSTGNHLHFQVELNGVPVDPAKYM